MLTQNLHSKEHKRPNSNAAPVSHTFRHATEIGDHPAELFAKLTRHPKLNQAV
jgi:hypothetical protein